jgi:threonine dehydrogenase-like Zn-dependent dehydrogenase
VRALRFDGTLKLVRDAPVPRREGEALVQVICAGICNTDLEIVKGYAGFRGTPGHEFVGRVVESPDARLAGRRVVGEINAGCGQCEVCLQGDSRHCASRTVLGIKNRDGAFAEFLSLPVGNLIEVPDSISDAAAVFVEPLAAAFNIIERISLEPSTSIAIVGDGKLAQLITVVMARTNCELAVVGRHEEKLKMARKHGAKRVLLDTDALDRRWDARFDVVIEASGSPSGLANALRLVKPRGIVVLKSTHHGATPVETSQVVVNEVTIIGSRCGRFQPALEFLARGSVDLSPLITQRLPLEDGLFAFHQAAHPDAMKVILQMHAY